MYVNSLGSQILSNGQRQSIRLEGSAGLCTFLLAFALLAYVVETQGKVGGGLRRLPATGHYEMQAISPN
jgi:hypothetical protein